MLGNLQHLLRHNYMTQWWFSYLCKSKQLLRMFACCSNSESPPTKNWHWNWLCQKGLRGRTSLGVSHAVCIVFPWLCFFPSDDLDSDGNLPNWVSKWDGDEWRLKDKSPWASYRLSANSPFLNFLFLFPSPTNRPWADNIKLPLFCPYQPTSKRGYVFRFLLLCIHTSWQSTAILCSSAPFCTDVRLVRQHNMGSFHRG